MQFVCLMVLFLFGYTYSIQSPLHKLRFRKQAECEGENHYRCKNGQCIESFLVCDGEPNCTDGSDEAQDTCSEKNMQEGCSLPNYPDGGSYQVKFCGPNGNCTGEPGHLVPLNSVLRYECSEGHILDFCGRNVFCFGGVWDPEPPKCLKQCEPLVSDSVDLECQYKSKTVRCDRPINPGTKVQPRCKTGYRLEDASVSFKETECQSDGTWEMPLFKCVPECGRINLNIEKLLISHGEVAPIAEYPWHAGLYIKIEDVWELVCGGTIISPNIILTAANCVYDKGSENVRNASDMRVAVGKFRRAWEHEDVYEQRLQIKEVIPQSHYRGILNSYQHDIAALILEQPIVLSTVVMPACLDWHSKGTFHEGLLGTVVGWGRTEEHVPSETLQMARLPYYDYDTCRKEAPSQFLRFITSDKFCAGYNNGTGVQAGDSGGGITFLRNKQHFIYGIVSVKLRDVNTFSAFTNVTQYIDWISNILKDLKQYHTY